MHASFLRALRSAVLATTALLALAPATARAQIDSTAAPHVSLQIVPDRPCQGDSVYLRATLGCCIAKLQLSNDAGGPVRVVASIPADSCARIRCLAPLTGELLLGRFAAGHHELVVDLEERLYFANGDSAVHHFSPHLLFDVRLECGSGFSEVPKVNHVEITSFSAPSPCLACPSPPPCVGHPIDVVVSGQFPDGCWSLESTEVLPLLSPVNLPVVRLNMLRAPLDPACALPDVIPAFRGHVTLPPELAGPHALEIQLALRQLPDSFTIRELIRQRVEYTVTERCPADTDTTHAGCVWPFLLPPPNRDSCDAVAPARGLAKFVLRSRSSTALAGLQGRIFITGPFRVVGLEPTGLASAMHLQWTRDERGARYVLWSEAGAPIPAADAEVLAVIVQADSSAAPGERAYLTNRVEVASDASGGDVPMCAVRHGEVAEPAVILCVARPGEGCDVNGDGVANVRDLVLMARCLRHPSADSDRGQRCHDCTGDGRFGIEDVICCARVILHAPGPRDSTGVHAEVNVAFGQPVAGPAGTVRIPVHLSGARGLGAALLDLRYPADRWRLVQPAEVTLRSSAAAAWLQLVEEAEPGLARLGAIRLADDDGDVLDLAIDLQLQPGAEPGGAIVVRGVELSDPFGAAIQPPPGAPSANLGVSGVPDAGIVLSRGRPDPFASETRFGVTLPRASAVELSVHDLAGRRVALLHHGSLPGGTSTITWRPGGEAKDGVYFVRLSVDGAVRSTRVVLRRSGR